MPKSKADIAAEAKQKEKQELIELIKNNDTKGFVDKIFQTMQDFALDPENDIRNTENVSYQKTQAASEVLKELTETDNPKNSKTTEVKDANKPFLKKVIREFNHHFVNAVISSGKARDEWERKIKNGEVPDTELIKDDPKTVKKVAHAIVLGQDPAGNAVMDAYRDLIVNLRHKTIDGIDSGEYLANDREKTRGIVCDKQRISYVKYKKYDHLFGDRNPSQSIGYKVSPRDPKEEGPLFTELPDYLVNIKNCKTEDDLEAYERRLFENKYKYDLHLKTVKSSIKTSKVLLKHLDNANKDGERLGIAPTEENKDARRALEAYTHLGTDFRYSAEYPSTDSIEPAVVSKATGDLAEYAPDFSKQATYLYYEHKKNGTLNTPTGKEATKKAIIAEDIQTLNEYIKYQNDKIFESGLNSTVVGNDMKNLAYLDKYRKSKGFFAAGKLENDSFTKSLDKLTDSISDSVINDCATTDCYDKLIFSVMDQKRIYQKMRSAEKQGDFNAYDKYTRKFTEIGNEIKDNIKVCKDFEEKYYEGRNISGKGVDRNVLLDNLSKTVSLKPGAPKPNYDSYMNLHSGAKAGATDDEKRKNISKVIAAYSLKKLGKPFSIKDIHKNAEQIEKIYLLDKDTASIYQNKDLESITKDIKSIIAAGEKQRLNLYGIKNDQQQQFIEDMKKLLKSMRSPNGRSKEYTHLYNTVKRASEMNEYTEGLPSKNRDDEFCQINLDVINAVQKYVKGKETVRRSTKGNEAFASSMDALSIVSKYTKQPGQEVNPIIADVVNEINTKRMDPELADLSKLENNYGATRANNVILDRKIEEHFKAPMKR
ncbi:hypothetical protein SAMN02910369_00267 [Lachnospiraceae bacterium NE2001]|nr:hypothetical protein SAMN02910369_00267 [Lachnospiraceae bacterium NE2001]